MKRTPITPLLLGMLVGCGGSSGSPDSGSSNPRTLYLAPDMAETRVKLTDAEPGPF
jgi:hypothetical protein